MRGFSLLLTVLVILAILSLSQAAGRLLGSGDYLSASLLFVLIVFLAAVNVLLIWRFGETIVAVGRSGTAYLIIFYLIVVSALGFPVAYRSYVSAPQFLIESIAIAVTVNDIQGTSGHIEADTRFRVLRSGLDHILWGNLGATGTIKDVTVRNLDPQYRYHITEQAGQRQVNLLFPNRLSKGQQVTFVLGFDVVGSEPGGDVYWEHDVTFPTQNLQMTITVPKGRPCKSADARSEDVGVIGAKPRDEPPPLISEDHTRLTWTRTEPQEGRAYIVTCH
jgi:hypothetical protein